MVEVKREKVIVVLLKDQKVEIKHVVHIVLNIVFFEKKSIR